MSQVFFFQAEAGIRDADVTGVQTCALPISARLVPGARPLLKPSPMHGLLSILIWLPIAAGLAVVLLGDRKDRKSTRLNSSHVRISYAVFCLKKKKKKTKS